MLLPALPSLMLLTELLLTFEGNLLPHGLQDLRQLTRLEKFGLHEYFGQPDLQSNSLTTLFLTCTQFCDDPTLPWVVDCSRLEHVMLSFPDADTNIDLDQLSPVLKMIWVDEAGGKVFLESRAIKRVHVQRVKNLTWSSDPATLRG